TNGTGTATDYTFTGGTQTASITAAPLSSTAAIGGTLTKTYDGTNAATGANVSGTVLGAITGDTITLNTTPVSLAYNGTHVVGTNAIVASGTAGYTIGGSTAGSLSTDYSFTAPTIASAAASITAAPLSSTAAIGGTLTKTYDGTNAATDANVSGTVLGAITGDTITLNTTPVSLAYNGTHVAGTNAIMASGTAGYTIGGSTAGSLSTDYSFTAPTI